MRERIDWEQFRKELPTLVHQIYGDEKPIETKVDEKFLRWQRRQIKALDSLQKRISRSRKKKDHNSQQG